MYDGMFMLMPLLVRQARLREDEEFVSFTRFDGYTGERTKNIRRARLTCGVRA